MSPQLFSNWGLYSPPPSFPKPWIFITSSHFNFDLPFLFQSSNLSTVSPSSILQCLLSQSIRTNPLNNHCTIIIENRMIYQKERSSSFLEKFHHALSISSSSEKRAENQKAKYGRRWKLKFVIDKKDAVNINACSAFALMFVRRRNVYISPWVYPCSGGIWSKTCDTPCCQQ